MRRTNGNSTQPATTFSGLVDQLFENNLGRMFGQAFGEPATGFRSQVPANVRETDKTYELELVAPGCKKEDFKVDVSGETLTVAMEHKEESRDEDKNNGWLRQEFRKQSFSRSFNLDDTIDANKITANYDNGVLHLTLPKKEGAQRISRTVSVQ
ncbi:MAG: small heat shock protein [Flavipsychrobacter sp.]|nr:small heat shock protein [Flavipsychrobacter sp.]